MNPGPLTLRELLWMAEGRNRRLWDHTASIVAAALSAFRDKMIDPAKLHPYERGGKRRKGIPLTAGNIQVLKVLVTGPERNSP